MSCHFSGGARAGFYAVDSNEYSLVKNAKPPRQRGMFWLLMSLALVYLLSGCVSDDPVLQPPAGLTYSMTSATYQAGAPIVANRPTASGGSIDRFTISPALPAGLSIDELTGVISGTPATASTSTVYTVTAQNAAGNATTRVQIEVRGVSAPPASLGYREAAVVYSTGSAIAANTPTSSGGPITNYSVTPSLPAGLALDVQTGYITGTPTAVTPNAIYTVTGSNEAGSTTATLQITVQAAVVAPVSLSFTTPAALYVTTEPITPNAPLSTGGAISTFNVSPALPAGLSLNTATGVISGTPSAVQSSVVYTITGSNSAGSVQAQVRITVTSRGTWTTAAPLLVPVHYFTATRLADGRVLVAGGFGASGITARAEIFDSASNTWTLTGAMASPRSGHTATLLLDGRVLVAGGSAAFPSPTVSSAEIYDPVSGIWSPAGNMNMTRENHTATLLPSGKVLVAGGYDSSGVTTFRSSVEVFDPTTNVWTPLNTTMAVARGQHAAELLPDGNVFLFGGVNNSGYVNNSERFAVNDSGTTTEAFPISGNVTLAARLADGTFLASTDASANAQRYSATTSSWTASTMNAMRVIPTFTTLADGRVLVAGGTLSGGTRTNSAEIYNPDTNTWTVANPMASGRAAHQAVLLADGSVLVISGFDGAGEVPTVERFQP